jgi:hypothetical protein
LACKTRRKWLDKRRQRSKKCPNCASNGTPVEGERLSTSVAAAGSGSGRVPLFASTPTDNLLSLPKPPPQTPHCVNTSSTFRPHFAQICAPKTPFCAHFASLMARKRKESKGFFVPTPKNLRQGVGRAHHTGSVGNK